MDIEERFGAALRAYEQGDYEQALAEFKAIAAIQPYASEVQLNLGNVHFRRGAPEEAEACFRKAIDLDPLEATAYLNLGNLYFRQDKTEEAVAVWEAYTRLNKKNANVWLNLGLAYDKLGDPQRAVDSYGVFLGLSPTSEEAGRLRLRFESARKMFDNNTRVAESLLARGNQHEARDILGKALAAYPGDLRLMKTYASLLYQDGDYREARIFYERAYALAPDDPAVLINLGVVYEKLDRPSDALWAYYLVKAMPVKEQAKVAQRFESLLAAKRGTLPNSLAEAQRLFRQGRLRQAEVLLGRLQVLSIHLDGDTRQEVQAWLEKVQESQDPTVRAAKAYYARGMDAEAGGRFDQALTFYRKFLGVQSSGSQADDVRSRVERIQTVMTAVISGLLDKSGADS